MSKNFYTQLIRPFLDRVFGKGTRQFAYFRFKAQEAKDLNASVMRIKTAKELGLGLSKTFVYSELGIPQPKPWEEILEKPQAKENTFKNAKNDEDEEDFPNAPFDAERARIQEAQEKQFDALISRLRILEQTQTQEEFQNAAKQLEADFPEIAGQILARNDIAEVMASAIIDKLEAREEFQNTIDKNGMRHDERGRFSGYSGTKKDVNHGNEEPNDIRGVQERYSEEFQRALQARGGNVEINDDLRQRLRGILRGRGMDAAGSVGNDSRWLDLNGFRVRENESPEVFHACFSALKPNIDNGELVDLHSVEDYRKCKCFLSDDGLQGIAVEKNGNIISVFNAEAGKVGAKKGWLGVVKHITDKTPNAHLDCYDSPKQPLVKIYRKKLGFKVAATMDYNMAFDHDNIAKNHGKPKIAFMVKTEKPVTERHFGKDDYDAAVKYQKSFLNQ